MAEYTKKLSLESFKKLVNGLSVLSIYLDDIDMRAGVVRQSTDDKTTLLVMDFSKIFEHDLCIACIKSKLTLLELISDDADDNITIQSNDKFWFVSNSKTAFKFAWSNPANLSTSFLADDKYNNNFVEPSKDELMLYNINITERNDIHKKIKKICGEFNSDKIFFTVNPDKIEMAIESVDKKNDAVILKEKNNGKIESKYNIVVRSTFIDKLDTKNLRNVIFYDGSGKSITKAVCQVEETLDLNVYTISKCEKS